MKYSFFQKYIVNKEVLKTVTPKEVAKFKHLFYSLEGADIAYATDLINQFPEELLQLYQEIGFGFLHCRKEYLNRIYDPASLLHINLLQNGFKFNKYIKKRVCEDRLIFLENHRGLLFSIDKTSKNQKNAIYYEGTKVAESLYNFLSDFSNDRDYIKYITT